MLGRWLGLTPEQPALCLSPEALPKALPGWVAVGVREPWGRLGGRYAKNFTICPTQACTKPTTCEGSTATSTTLHGGRRHATPDTASGQGAHHGRARGGDDPALLLQAGASRAFSSTVVLTPVLQLLSEP